MALAPVQARTGGRETAPQGRRPGDGSPLWVPRSGRIADGGRIASVRVHRRPNWPGHAGAAPTISPSMEQITGHSPLFLGSVSCSMDGEIVGAAPAWQGQFGRRCTRSMRSCRRRRSGRCEGPKEASRRLAAVPEGLFHDPPCGPGRGRAPSLLRLRAPGRGTKLRLLGRYESFGASVRLPAPRGGLGPGPAVSAPGGVGTPPGLFCLPFLMNN